MKMIKQILTFFTLTLMITPSANAEGPIITDATLAGTTTNSGTINGGNVTGATLDAATISNSVTPLMAKTYPLAGTELIPLVDMNGTPTGKKITFGDLEAQISADTLGVGSLIGITTPSVESGYINKGWPVMFRGEFNGKSTNEYYPSSIRFGDGESPMGSGIWIPGSDAQMYIVGNVGFQLGTPILHYSNPQLALTIGTMTSGYNFTRTKTTGLATAVTGTAQAGTSNTITLVSTASKYDNEYAGYKIKITSVTGSGQSGVIASYNGTTKVATMIDDWALAPDSGWGYTIPVQGVIVSTGPQVNQSSIVLTDTSNYGFCSVNMRLALYADTPQYYVEAKVMCQRGFNSGGKMPDVYETHGMLDGGATYPATNGQGAYLPPYATLLSGTGAVFLRPLINLYMLAI